MLPQPLGKLQHRQRCKRTQAIHAPAIQRFENFYIRGERANRQTTEMRGFFSFGNDGDSGESPRGKNRRLDVGSYSHMRDYAYARNALLQFLRDVFIRAE